MAQPESLSQARSNLRWYICALLFIATTINYVDRNVFSLLEPKLHELRFMGYDPAHPEIFNAHYSTILAWFQAAYGLSFLVAGWFIDRVGTKIGYAISIMVWSLAAASHALVGSVGGFIFARIALGLGEAGNFPAAIKATTEWFPTEERALATGIFNSGANMAALAAPAIVAIIAGRWGWQSAFITTGLAGLLWLALWLPFPYEKRRRNATLTQPDLKLENIADLGPTKNVARKTTAFAVLKFLPDPVWWFFLFWLPKYFSERYGLSMQGNALPLFIIYLGSAVGSIAGGWLSGFAIKRGMSVNVGRKLALGVCALCALPVITVPLQTNMWVAVGILALATAAHQGFSANVYSSATDMFPSSRISTIVGLGGAAGSLGGILFTKFVGAVWVSHPQMIFTIAGCAYVLALLIFHVLVPRLGEREPRPLEEPTNP